MINENNAIFESFYTPPVVNESWTDDDPPNIEEQEWRDKMNQEMNALLLHHTILEETELIKDREEWVEWMTESAYALQRSLDGFQNDFEGDIDDWDMWVHGEIYRIQETSKAFDRREKRRLYRRYGIGLMVGAGVANIAYHMGQKVMTSVDTDTEPVASIRPDDPWFVLTPAQKEIGRFIGLKVYEKNFHGDHFDLADMVGKENVEEAILYYIKKEIRNYSTMLSIDDDYPTSDIPGGWHSDDVRDFAMDIYAAIREFREKTPGTITVQMLKKLEAEVLRKRHMERANLRDEKSKDE